MAQLHGVLATPLVAICAGLALGVVLVAPMFWSIRLLNAKNADSALFVVIGSVFGGLLAGLAVMMGYWFLSREGFMYFGPATVVGFVIALGALAVRTGIQLLKDTNESKG